MNLCSTAKNDNLVHIFNFIFALLRKIVHRVEVCGTTGQQLQAYMREVCVYMGGITH